MKPNSLIVSIDNHGDSSVNNAYVAIMATNSEFAVATNCAAHDITEFKCGFDYIYDVDIYCDDTKVR